ncbi:MAG: glycosyltransferase [Bryobacteraceae bacterium]|nr:glycosyltransferase [Bryobacteraceae bacterium]
MIPAHTCAKDILLEGPFESDYSLAVVNRELALALIENGVRVALHQRDHTTAYPVSEKFRKSDPSLAACLISDPADVSCFFHSRYIYPPFTDHLRGVINGFHLYGWEETGFPAEYVDAFNNSLDIITVMSTFVKEVLEANGVRVPIVVTGLGADHILRQPPVPTVLEGSTIGRSFRFLHISSCFPRKAPDVLIEAFCQEFGPDEPVELVIKTFDNIHNRIFELLAEADQKYRDHPPIRVITRSFSLPEMRWLIESADCLISASRGEGFGLPVAEAMLLRTPVVATPIGGQADLCNQENSWLVDYQMEEARSHLSRPGSKWAEPSIPSLRKQLRAVFEAPENLVVQKCEAARRHIEENYTWSHVARKYLSALADGTSRRRAALTVSRRRFGHPMRVGVMTTWNVRCGIAEYSRYLVESIQSDAEVVVFAEEGKPQGPDKPSVIRCWTRPADPKAPGKHFERLVQSAIFSGVDIINIQFNFGFIHADGLRHVISALAGHGIPSVVTLHSVTNPRFLDYADAFRMAAACFVHRVSDVDRLKAAGVKNVYHIDQGIPAVSASVRHRPSASNSSTTTIASFGFILPPKGVYELIQAFRLVSRLNPNLRLKLFNALYPIPDSAEYASLCRELIDQLGLGSKVDLYPAFLEDREVIEELAKTDLIVLPYTYSSESASAAIRIPMASATPILCSDLSIFDEFHSVVHRFRAGDVFDLSRKLLLLTQDPVLRNRYRAQQEQILDRLGWPRVGRRILSLMKEALAMTSKKAARA